MQTARRNNQQAVFNVNIACTFGNHSSAIIGDCNQVNGEQAQGNINGAAEIAVLKERVQGLERLLRERDRVITILLQQKQK